MKLTLPFPPSVNGYYRSLRSGKLAGRVLISEKGRKYREEVKRAVGWHVRTMTGRLTVSIILNPPDRRKRDIDNYCKGLLDALTHAGVWRDDSQIKRLCIELTEVHTGEAVISIDEEP